MRFAFPRISKPPIGTPLDASSQLQRGLIYFVPFWEGTGTHLLDVVGALPHTFTNSPPWVAGQGGFPFCGLQLTASGARAATATLSAATQALCVWPMSIAVGFSVVSTSSVGNLLALLGNSGNAALSLQTTSTNGVQISFLNATTSSTLNKTGLTSVGTASVASATVTASARTLYFNGNQVSTAASGISNPTLGATPTFTFGAAGIVVDSIVYWAAVWNRALSAAEHTAVGQNIWQIFRPVMPAGILGGQPFGTSLVPILRPFTDRTGSRRPMWAE
jgi:hypothetical protein